MGKLAIHRSWLFGKVNTSSQWNPKSHSFPSIQRDVSKTTTSWVHKITFNLGIIKGVWSWRCSKVWGKGFFYCWAHCPLKALSLRPHKTCPYCLECTKVIEIIAISWLPTIVLPFSNLHLYHIERVDQTRFVHKGSTKFRGILFLLGWDRVPQAKIACSQRIEQNYIKCCINSFGVGLL